MWGSFSWKRKDERPPHIRIGALKSLCWGPLQFFMWLFFMCVFFFFCPSAQVLILTSPELASAQVLLHGSWSQSDQCFATPNHEAPKPLVLEAVQESQIRMACPKNPVTKYCVCVCVNSPCLNLGSAYWERLNGRKGSKLLPAISCGFLRLQTTYLADQRPNLQKSAKIFDKLPFLPFSLSHLALLN